MRPLSRQTFGTILRDLLCRGGVKDTRHEAKAKNTKKFRGQGQEQTLSRPRTQKNFKAKCRPSQGQDQGHRRKCSQKKKKKRSSKIFFRRSQKKNVSKNFFQAKKVFKNFFSGDLYLRKPKKRSLHIFRKVSGVFERNFNGSKIVLSSSRGPRNFRGLEASRPRPRTYKCVLEDVLKAKDVLEDSTSAIASKFRTSKHLVILKLQ